MRTHEFKVISNNGGVYLVCKFYRNSTMGECHVSYMQLVAHDDAVALEIAKQALGA